MLIDNKIYNILISLILLIWHAVEWRVMFARPSSKQGAEIGMNVTQRNFCARNSIAESNDVTKRELYLTNVRTGRRKKVPRYARDTSEIDWLLEFVSRRRSARLSVDDSSTGRVLF